MSPKLDLTVLELDKSLDFTVTPEVIALWRTARERGTTGDLARIEDWLRESVYAVHDSATGEWALRP